MDETTVPAEGSAEGQLGGDNSEPEFDSSFLDDVILDIGEHKATRETYSSDEDKEEEPEKSGDADDKKKVEPEKQQEKKPTKEKDDDAEEDTPVIRQMRQTIKNLQKQVKRLESDKPEDGSKTKKADEPEPLSDDQLKALLKEHADDPEVQFNIFKYMQERGIKDATKASRELAHREKVASAADKYFSGIFNGYGNDDFNDQLNNDFPLDQWGLNGHPLARQIQTALALASTFPGAVQREVQKAIQAKQSEKDKVEDKRKEVVNQRGGLPKPTADTKTTAQPVLNEQRRSVAKELGLTPAQQKLYANLLGKKKG